MLVKLAKRLPVFPDVENRRSMVCMTKDSLLYGLFQDSEPEEGEHPLRRGLRNPDSKENDFLFYKCYQNA